MERRELLRKIAAFHLVSRDLAEDLLVGEFASVFRGQGIEFDEVRQYEPDDDIRAIDWNVSARFGKPFVKLYREEREITVFIVLDCSASMRSGGIFQDAGKFALTRYDQGVLAAALIAFSAERTGQRVGAVFFDQDIIRVYSPRKGRPHVLALISAALEVENPRRGSGLGAALAGTKRILKRRSLVVVISDFLCVNWEQELGDLCARHDVIAVKITDPLDREIPPIGLAALEDGETGYHFHAPVSSPSFRAAWSEWHEDRTRLWQSVCRRAGAARLELSTAVDAPAVLARFFRGELRRNYRLRRRR
ncbi:MAG: DUF58 domain-containing protein [Spirochaetaceae bacterium]|jgi:uncharacterized protein (DUF58 family)|nr:DUF58 domain-containing protein [Spirochaetaceae bacterium]